MHIKACRVGDWVRVQLFGLSMDISVCGYVRKTTPVYVSNLIHDCLTVESCEPDKANDVFVEIDNDPGWVGRQLRVEEVVFAPVSP